MAEEKYSKKGESRRFYKSRRDKMLDGVCGGLSEYLGIDPTLVRILWFLSVFVNGLGIIAYLLAMIFVPVNPAHKNLKEDEKRKNNVHLFWGVVLIVFGLFFLYRHWSVRYYWDFPSRFPFWQWWNISWGSFWALGLIFLGIAYIVYVLRREKEGEGKSEQNKPQKATTRRKFYRTPDDKVLGGVCGGIARYFNADPTLIRIGFAVFALITDVFLWILIYVILFFILPKESTEETVTGSKP